MIIRVTVSEKNRDTIDEAGLQAKLNEMKAKIIKECMGKLVNIQESMNER